MEISRPPCSSYSQPFKSQVIKRTEARLFWQAGGPQRLTKLFGKRWRAIYTGKLMTVSKGWLKLEYSRGGRRRFVQSAKFG
jgi:hypothetical protein